VRSVAAVLFVIALSMSAGPSVGLQGQERRRVGLAAVGGADLRVWDTQVDRMIRGGELQLRLEREDTLMPGRRHTRFTQMVNGVPVYGGDVARQSDDKGLTVSIFGTVYEGVDVSTDPAIGPDRARAIVARETGVDLGPGRLPRLAILPRDSGEYRLVYTARVATPEDITLFFIDAQTGAIVDRRSDAYRQTASVGLGTGVLGGRKKISASSQGGTFVESDRMRPPVIETYDMRGNLTRTLNFLNGFTSLNPSDFASDSDNDWTDGANVDAHVYAGYTYDYFFKRFGRRGLDNANVRIRSLTHPVNRQDAFSASLGVLGTFYVNAFYAGDGIMVYGEGLPSNVTLGGQQWNFTSGSLDIVAHELSHGVTDYTSQLIYANESGALNEAFSDIMGSAISFFYAQPETGSGSGNYVIGDDVVTPGGIRSMENPRALGDPDHYQNRFTGTDDNGGVHINSTIVSHAYYLSVEGGTNRTSGLSVQGIGGPNREQMEKVFYRAFTQLLPANATFATARAATIRAAQDLYGANSAAERAVTQAWTAVGVN
jgi:Zn-dependent metalloprotease